MKAKSGQRCYDGRTGLRHIEKDSARPLLLDLMLPKLPASKFAAKFAGTILNRLPILMLTRRGEEADRRRRSGDGRLTT